MPILIAEDNVAQRHYLREMLTREFAAHGPVMEAAEMVRKPCARRWRAGPRCV